MKLTAKTEEKARKVRMVLLDVDGVLTDGRLTYQPDGTELKTFHTHDGVGIRLAQKASCKPYTGLLSNLGDRHPRCLLQHPSNRTRPETVLVRDVVSQVCAKAVLLYDLNPGGDGPTILVSPKFAVVFIPVGHVITSKRPF